MLTLKMKKTLATLVASLALACAVFAAERTLPTPPASSFPDTESSLCVPLPDWPTLGRRVTFTLTANTKPSNCVQVALGQDTDSNGDLEPEETMLCIGVDCGEPFARWEVVVGSRSPTVDVTDSTVGLGLEPTTNPTPTLYTFSFKQPVEVPSRMNFAKVTTRGHGNSAAEIAAEITRPGVALLIR